MKSRALNELAVLDKIIAKAASDSSFPARLADVMSQESGNKFYRQEVALWIHPDETKRAEPRLGAGLLLLRCGKALKAHKARSKK